MAYERPAQTCHLLRPPRELRDKIYGYLIVKGKTITAYSVRRLVKGLPPPYSTGPGWTVEQPTYETKSFPDEQCLASACERIRDEVLDNYYAGTTFGFVIGHRKRSIKWSRLPFSQYRNGNLIKHLILYFDITYIVRGSDVEHSQYAAGLELTMSSGGKAAMRAMDWLAKKCVCHLDDELQDRVRVMPNNGEQPESIRFATTFEAVLYRRYNRKTQRWANN